jgi:gas vesicle protein
MNSKFLLGLLTGVAVGVTLGVLFAPDQGAKTRRKIARKTAKAKAAAEETFNDFVDTIKQKFSLAQEDVEHAVQEAKSKATTASKTNAAKKVKKT